MAGDPRKKEDKAMRIARCRTAAFKQLFDRCMQPDRAHGAVKREVPGERTGVQSTGA